MLYELTTDFQSFYPAAAQELRQRGYAQITDRTSSGLRVLRYESRDRTIDVVFFVETGKPSQEVGIQIHDLRPRSQIQKLFNEITSDGSRRTYPRMVCIANLKQLCGAKATWALEANKATNDVPTDADLFGPAAYIRTKPTCPQGGTYTLGRVDEDPRCSILMHNLW